MSGNMTWNEEHGQLMFIDFERTMLQARRILLESIFT